MILDSTETEIAAKFVEAAQVYENHPGALQLRTMNIIDETTKERGATILIPRSMVDNLNSLLALAIAGRDAGEMNCSARIASDRRGHFTPSPRR